MDKAKTQYNNKLECRLYNHNTSLYFSPEGKFFKLPTLTLPSSLSLNSCTKSVLSIYLPEAWKLTHRRDTKNIKNILLVVGTVQRSYPNEGHPSVGEPQNVRNRVGGDITELQGNQTMKRFVKPTIKKSLVGNVD